MPRVVDPVNINTQTYDVLTDGELATMEKNMGKLFHFNAVNPTGHYSLQLAKGFDRVLCKRLAEITEEQGSMRKEASLIDTSQKGDWDNFRNETLNSHAYDFEVEILSAGALTAGVLEFDFVSTDSNHRTAIVAPMADEVFELFMDELWQARKKVTTGDKESQSDRAGGAGVVGGSHDDIGQFSELYPDALQALATPKDQRSDDQVSAIMSMLKTLGFPIKALSAVQRMINTMEYVVTPPKTNAVNQVRLGSAPSPVLAMVFVLRT